MFEDDTLTADVYTRVVYLKADGGTLVLEPDECPGSGDASWTPPGAKLTRREIDVRPGRLVAWPNHAFKHCAGRRDVVEGEDAVAGRGGCSGRLPPPVARGCRRWAIGLPGPTTPDHQTLRRRLSWPISGPITRLNGISRRRSL